MKFERGEDSFGGLWKDRELRYRWVLTDHFCRRYYLAEPNEETFEEGVMSEARAGWARAGPKMPRRAVTKRGSRAWLGG